VLGAGAAASVPTSGQTGTIVIFRPDVGPNEALAAVIRANATISDVSPSGQSMVIVLSDPGARWSLYRNGALLVGGGALAGCGTQPLRAPFRV
jgi:hypothetical protein